MAPPTKGAGLVLRLYTQSSPSANFETALSVSGASIQKITTISSTDDKTNEGDSNSAVIYKVLHISRFLIEGAFAQDPAHKDDSVADLQWQVYKLMYERSREGLEASITPKGSVMIYVGVIPLGGTEDDYAKWFDTEHAELLSLVPGWRSSARYALANAFGAKQVATPFLAVHFYDEVNRLGGAEWRRSTETEWTQKIRSSCKPHVRRIWRVEHDESLV